MRLLDTGESLDSIYPRLDLWILLGDALCLTLLVALCDKRKNANLLARYEMIQFWERVVFTDGICRGKVLMATFVLLLVYQQMELNALAAHLVLCVVLI